MTAPAANQGTDFESLGYPQFVNDLPRYIQARLVTKQLAKALNELDDLFLGIPGETAEEKAMELMNDPRTLRLYKETKVRERRLRDVAESFGPPYDTKIIKKAEDTYGSWLDTIKPPSLGDL